MTSLNVASAATPIGASEASGPEKKAYDPRTRALIEGPIAATLVRLAVPNMLVMLAQSSVGLVETYFVGKLGTDALAGVALVFPLLMLMLGLAHINLYANAPSAIWIGIIIGVVGLSGMYWLYRYSVKSENVRLRRFVEHATFGRNLATALEQIDEIRNFEKSA